MPALDPLVLTDDLLTQPAGGGCRGSAVKKLRRELGDSAQNPRYIVTEPWVGYRTAADEGEGG